MKLDGFGLFVDDMPTMIRFYRDVLGFEITEDENAENVYLIKDGTLFMLYERKNFEKMTSMNISRVLMGISKLLFMLIPLIKLIRLIMTQFQRVPFRYCRPKMSHGDSVPAT